jgi:hypothetical protein
MKGTEHISTRRVILWDVRPFSLAEPAAFIVRADYTDIWSLRIAGAQVPNYMTSHPRRQHY